MKVRLAVAALALAAMGSYAQADITGKVTLDGKAPEMNEIDMSTVKECATQHADPVIEESIVADEQGNLANVIVAIKAADGQELTGDAPSEPAVLDQEGCMYHPHVLAMMAGQKLVVKNSDAFLHNVHSLATVNQPFNFGQPTKDPGKEIESPKAEEYFRVKCDVHPWMSAFLGVFEHPFFAVTKEDGTFTIKTDGLADGQYTVTFWHEQLATEPVEQMVEVKDGKAEVNQALSAESAQAEPAVGQPILASSSGQEIKCETSACCKADATAKK